MAAAPDNNTNYLMNGTLVHRINGRFFASCIHFIFVTGQGSVFVLAMGHHGGPCFSNIPLGENPTSSLQLSYGNEYGFEYKQGHSTAAIFFSDSRRELHVLPYDYFHIQNHIPLPGPFLSSLPLLNRRHEASICSSTRGLVLFRDEEYLHLPDSNNFCYYVINPTVVQDYGSRRLPNPPIPHGPQDSAILTFNEDDLSYNVVCAVQLNDDVYRLDVFRSCTGNWTSPLTLQGFGHISNELTVSCGKSAYWIAKQNVQSLLRYNVDTQTVTSLILPHVPPGSSTQIGRIGNTVGLVIAFQHMVELYLLGHQDIWVPFGFLDLSMALSSN